ncbi:MAG TPA: blue light sensor protein, partial [Psychrobacter sp.]|nr:blue light sensor protein [Psychrobacter sp.]
MPLTRSNRIKQWDAMQESVLVQLVYVSTLTLGSRLNTSIFEDIEAHARDYNE